MHKKVESKVSINIQAISFFYPHTGQSFIFVDALWNVHCAPLFFCKIDCFLKISFHFLQILIDQLIRVIGMKRMAVNCLELLIIRQCYSF